MHTFALLFFQLFLTNTSLRVVKYYQPLKTPVFKSSVFLTFAWAT